MLWALEEQGWEALSTENGGAFYRDYLTDDALMVFPFGVLAKDRTIEAIEAAPPWASYRLEEPRIVQLTDSSAIVTYRATARREGAETAYSALMSSVYVNRDGAWKLAFHQQTPLSEG